jgi:tetratricopeptide (TPR) repeat protein
MTARFFTKFLSLFILLLWARMAFTQDFNSLIQDGAKLEKEQKELQALKKYTEAQKLKPTDLHVLYKCSELYSRIGVRETNTASQEQYYKSSLAYAQMAYKYYPQSDDANVAMSMALGRLALTRSGKEKVSTVKEIKTYADNAIRINPKNFKAWHIIGKWNYEVSNLGFFEKTAIKLIYGGLPNSSFSESVKAYEKVKELNPYFGSNYLELAKAYQKLDDNINAQKNLKYVIAMPNYTEEDPIVKTRATQLLSEIE